MKCFTLGFVFLFVSAFGLNAQTVIYSGASDPVQINGAVPHGNISTDGDLVISTGNWATVAVESGEEESSKVKQTLPSTFDARWKYEAGTITDGVTHGFTIKYNDELKDEFRCLLDTTMSEGLVIFWGHWGAGGLAGNDTWNVKNNIGFPGANVTSPLIDIPDEAVTFRITFDGEKYEVFYGQADEGWVLIPEMTLAEADFPKFIAHSMETNMREFQIVTESGESRLDWIKIEGDGLPAVNEDVTEEDNLFESDEAIGGGTPSANVFIYSGASDPEQINGAVAHGAINTDGDFVIATGNWATLAIEASEEETSKAKMSLPSSFDARWKYETGTIVDGITRGFTVKYNAELHDEFRCLLDTTMAEGLVIFWGHWGEGGLAGNGTWTTKPNIGFPGANVTSPLIDIPDEAVTFRITFDGEKYEVFYGQADEGWVPIPEMTLAEADFPKFIAHSMEANMREFQINTETGESRLDWLRIEGDDIPNLNADVEEDDNLFDSDDIITSVKELKAASVKIYPNPFNDLVTIEGTENIRSVSLFNILGETILQQNNLQLRQVKLNLGFLNSGIYILKIDGASNQITSKRIIKK